ncbi:hypothetical protein DRW41_11300 [Neobacillus piezotolerans]|uniref:Uncharacterized protein n=1 Tax=Neobacillus piezotolerans TaxID=2259171 RepID=A0A3D8GR20_9BACI|nr:hypothetical protein DRW41_11300 [Neobacillus piezotolerans]
MQRQGGDPAGASAEEAPLTPRGKRVPRDRQKPPVPAMIILGSFLLWSGNQPQGTLEYTISDSTYIVALKKIIHQD